MSTEKSEVVEKAEVKRIVIDAPSKYIVVLGLCLLVLAGWVFLALEVRKANYVVGDAKGVLPIKDSELIKNAIKGSKGEVPDCIVLQSRGTIKEVWESGDYTYRLWYRTNPYQGIGDGNSAEYNCLFFNVVSSEDLEMLYRTDSDTVVTWNLVGDCTLYISNGCCSLISNNKGISNFRTWDFYIEER